MNKTNELICAHSALPFMVALGAGIFLISGWLPPIDPAMDEQTLKSLLLENVGRIRFGLCIAAFGCILYWSFSAAIAMQMKRMEGDSHPLAYVQMAAATGTVLPVIIPCFLWFGALYRIETVSAENLQLINDIAWIFFIGFYPPGVLQNVSIGLCILTADEQSRVYPRWVAYLCFWISVGFMPAALLPFFQTGPFTWMGLFGFWVVASSFFVWIIALWLTTVSAIHKRYN